MAGVFKVVILFVCAMMLLPGAGLADGLVIYSAGSLNGALTEIIKDFPAPPGSVAAPVFGPSGVLRKRIEHGEAADILASADMAQPRLLAHAGQPVIMFTRNRLCAVGREGLKLTSDTLLDRMLDPSVRLATSTPGADPSGDYAWAIFARAEAVHPGAQAILQAKALQLVGGLLQRFGGDHERGARPGIRCDAGVAVGGAGVRHGRVVGSAAGRALRVVRDVRAGTGNFATIRL
jgi:ABC-type molybdate transport system substrate-binding protein